MRSGMYPRKSSLTSALVIGVSASLAMLASASWLLMIALGAAHGEAPQVPALSYWATVLLTWALSGVVTLGASTSARK